MSSALAAAPPGLAPAMVILVVVLGSDVWVYFDPARHRDAGVPVVMVIGNLRIESPEGWGITCLFLWLIAFPLYLISRSSVPSRARRARRGSAQAGLVKCVAARQPPSGRSVRMAASVDRAPPLAAQTSEVVDGD